MLQLEHQGGRVPFCCDASSCVACPAFSMPASWKGVRRVLIEFCTYGDSELCRPAEYSADCFCIRCTKETDMTDPRNVRSLLSVVRAVPKGIVITLWSAVPCTGGSCMQNANKHRPNFQKRMLSSFAFMASAVLCLSRDRPGGLGKAGSHSV